MSSKDTIKVILVLVAFVASLNIVWDIFSNVSEVIKDHPFAIGVLVIVIISLFVLKGSNEDK
jgi:multidrug transporter EmrE-like cation transporter